MAIIVFSALFWAAAARATVVIDGTRYHFLDDDQMISMRYARNLAEGHGPVWNPGGERVEGYTNAGWMLVMAAVHRLGAPDSTAALWVRAVNWALACAVLLLAAGLLKALDVTHGLPLFAALFALALADDLLFWSVNGFETTLLTALFLSSILLALRDARRGELSALTCFLAGLLAVVRADAVDLTMGVVITAIVLGARRKWWWLALAALPLIAHEAFRVTYYGDWFPNTYYLKVAGRAGLFWGGLGHIKGFVAIYTVAIVLVAAVCIATRDRRVWVLSSLLVLGFGRLLFVGPDIFPGFRFLAPYVPILVVLAASAVAHLPRDPIVRWTMAAVLLLATVFNAGVSGRTGLRTMVSLNGRPVTNTVIGVMMHRHASPRARVVVAAAGCLPYFSRLAAIDLLGKSDHHVARVRPATPGRTGHNRFDVDWSLRTRPDFVATFSSHALVSHAAELLPLVGSGPTVDYGGALLLNRIFIEEYRAQPVTVPALLDNDALFVHRDSPERAHLSEWRAPTFSRP